MLRQRLKKPQQRHTKSKVVRSQTTQETIELIHNVATAEPEEPDPEDAESSDEGPDDEDQREEDEGQLSDEEGETQTVVSGEHASTGTDSDEDIVVHRQEEQRDPEADAEFDRELAKMMAEGLESRKFDRKAVFDVPLPIKRHLSREPTMESEVGEQTSSTPGKMAFSLLTKRGNRQQVY